MDAKTRYRRRLKLQAALTRVLEVLVANSKDGIEPDRTTALMAWQVVQRLNAFVKESGLEPAELLESEPLQRFGDLIKARRKESAARRRRRAR